MMRNRNGVAIGVVVLVLGLTGSAWAIWPGLWLGYNPTAEDEMPDASWTLTNGDNPIRRLVGGHAVTADGIAHIDCASTTGRWNKNSSFNAATGFTVDFRVKDLLGSASNCGIALRMTVDDVFGMIVKVNGRGSDGDSSKSRLSLIWSGSNPPDTYTADVEDTHAVDGFHTWRVAVKGTLMKIYADDIVDPVYTREVVEAADPNLTYVSFGDWGASSNGNADLDYVVWHLRALFAPPFPVPPVGTIIVIQ